MQSKIAHAAERKAFSVIVDQLIKTASADDREEKIDKLIDMAGKLLKDTVPGAAAGMRAALYPGSKWEKWLFDIIDESDPNVFKTMLMNGAYEAAFRGYRVTFEKADELQCNVPWIVLFDPTSACNKHCVGCWAADYGNRLNLSFEDMDKLVTEAKAWGRICSCSRAASPSCASATSCVSRRSTMTVSSTSSPTHPLSTRRSATTSSAWATSSSP